AAVEIWLRALQGAPPRLELPARAAAGGEGASAERTLDAALCERLGEIAGGKPLAAVLLASLWVLVARHTGQDDIVALYGGAGAQAPARGRLEDDPSFAELVVRADAAIVEAERWPVELSALDEGLARGGQALAWQVSLRLVDGVAPVDAGVHSLAVELRPDANGLWIGLRGDPSLFDGETLRAWAMRWEVLLRGAAQGPERPVSALPLLSAQERAAAAAAWNDTAMALPTEQCVHSLVDAQIARTPDAIAVIAEEGQLSYAELGARASRLAAALRRRGVGPEVLVAICAERSLDLIVGLLAILRAGGAYVPLDPDHPRDRLAYMLADTSARLLLTQRALVAGLPAFDGEILLLDELDELDELADIADPAAGEGPAVTASNLVYVIYTSGSTGRPKGAMNIHRGVVNRLLYLQRVDPLGPDDRVLQKTPCSFDISVYEYFWPLLAGATLVMARPGGHKDPGYLLEVIREHSITIIHFVPPMLAVFLEQADLSACGSLRRVLCTGDVLPPAVVQRCFMRLDVELYNLYGPTEASIEVTMYRCRRDEACAVVPIGQPMANTTIYLLDRHGEPVPPGAPGELFIGGVQVGRGYLGRPDLTAASFVPDPFSDDPGARLYRTGDLARRRADGELEFLGRRDQQAKIRGVRVELGEIEAMLREHPGVRDVVVVVSQAAGGDKQLAAYLLANEGAVIEAAGLHAWACERLPVYMVPGAFMVLESFPLLSNGKLDRKSLPPAVAFRPVSSAEPRTETERAVAALWYEVLGLERCGVDDDLLMLGGHSLHAAQLLGRVRDGFAVELVFPEIFAHPTIAALARLIDERRGAATAETRAPAPAEALSPAEERLFFLHGLAPDSPAYHCPSIFRVRGPFAPAQLESAVRAVVARHEVLRARFIEVDGEARRITSPDDSFELRTVELPGASADDLLGYLAAEVARPFDLRSAPPIRAGVLRIAADDHVLWLNLHHIVTDGRSTAILLREVSAVYEALCAGEAPALPGPPLAHAEVVALQRAALASEAPRLERWKQRLAGVSRLELPVDGPCPGAPTWRGGQVGFAVSGELFDRLRSLARRRGATPSMAILAVIAAWLRRVTGQDDRVIALIAAARGRSALENVVGFLVDTLPIRVELAGEAGFGALLEHVRARALEAQDGEHVPLERVVKALALPRDAGRDPLIQVAFAPQPAGERDLRLAGAMVEPITVDRGAAIFDLTILTWEAAGGGLEVVFEYASDLFSRARAESMMRSFAAVFAAAVDEPEAPVARLAMASASEREALLAASHGPQPARERVGAVHAYFEAQAERTP
ncbi:MAG TPA: amino acid adenylation domain-containing protein, partial [Nannocystis sp.]